MLISGCTPIAGNFGRACFLARGLPPGIKSTKTCTLRQQVLRTSSPSISRIVDDLGDAFSRALASLSEEGLRRRVVRLVALAMSPNGSAVRWIDWMLMLFGCRRRTKVSVHCHTSSPRPSTAYGPGKPPVAGAVGSLSDVFCCHGTPSTNSSSGASGGFFPPLVKGIISSGVVSHERIVAASFAPKAGAVEPVFCTTGQARATMATGDRGDGGVARRDGGKLPLEELPNGTRKSKTRQGANMQEQKLKLQQQQRQQQTRPSYRWAWREKCC